MVVPPCIDSHIDSLCSTDKVSVRHISVSAPGTCCMLGLPGLVCAASAHGLHTELVRSYTAPQEDGQRAELEEHNVDPEAAEAAESARYGD